MRAWAEETLSASRSFMGVPSGTISLVGIPVMSWAETQGMRNIVRRKYAGILRRYALDNECRLHWWPSLSPATAKDVWAIARWIAKLDVPKLGCLVCSNLHTYGEEPLKRGV